MQRAIDEIERRRTKQIAHNTAHGIIPMTIVKANRTALEGELASVRDPARRKAAPRSIPRLELLDELESEMAEAAQNLEFERAAHLRDEAARVRQMEGEFIEATAEDESSERTKDHPPGSAARRASGRQGRRRK